MHGYFFKTSGIGVVLLVLMIFQCWQMGYYFAHEDLPPYSDAAFHFQLSLNLYEALHQGERPVFSTLFDVSPYYPPLLYWVSVVNYYLVGPGWNSSKAAMIPFMFILTWSVYLLGKRLHQRSTGLFGAIIISMMPGAIIGSRSYYLDYPLLAMVAAGLAYGVVFAQTPSWKNAIGFGLVCGIGMLTKWTFVVFMTPIIVYLLWQYYLDVFSKSALPPTSAPLADTLKAWWQTPAKILMSSLVAAGISSLWYLRHIRHLFRAFFGHELGSRQGISMLTFGDGYEIVSKFDTRALLYYVFGIQGEMLQFVWAAALLLAVITMPWKQWARIGWLWLSVLASLVFFLYIPNKVPRYLLPILIVFSITIAYRVELVSNRWVRRALQCILTGYGLVYTFAMTIGIPILPDFWFTNTPYGAVVWFCQVGPAGINDYKTDWKIRDIIKEIEHIHQQSCQSSETVTVAVVTNHNSLSSVTMDGLARCFGYDTRYLFLGPGLSESELYHTIMTRSFVITKSSYLGAPGTLGEIEKVFEKIMQPNSLFYEAFEKKKTFELPDQTQAVIWLNRLRCSPEFDLDVKFGTEVVLAGYSRKNHPAHPGSEGILALHWQGPAFHQFIALLQWKNPDSGTLTMSLELPLQIGPNGQLVSCHLVTVPDTPDFDIIHLTLTVTSAEHSILPLQQSNHPTCRDEWLLESNVLLQ